MEERKISERNKKYNDEHSSSMTHNKILNAREANLLKLRRNKIEEQIMSKRMKNFTGVFEPSKYSHLELSEEDFSFVITEQYEQEFNNYDQKLEIIKQLLNEDYSSLQYFNINCANHDIITKYAVYKLRVMSFEWKSVNDEGVEFDTELFDQLLVILFNTRDLKLQAEITWILINLTAESKYYTEHLMSEDLITKVFQLTFSPEIGIITNAIWILCNLINDEEECHKIIDTIPLIERINTLCQQMDKLELEYDFANLLWLMDKIISPNAEFYAEKFTPSYEHLINFLKFEVEDYIETKKGSRQYKVKDLKTKIEIVKYCLKLIERVIKYDGEHFNKILQPDLVKTLLIIIKEIEGQNLNKVQTTSITNINNTNINLNIENMHNIAPNVINLEEIILSLRIIGGLVAGTNNEGTELILNQGVIKIYERLLQLFLLNNSYNSTVLKEMAWGISNIVAGAESHTGIVILKSSIGENFLEISVNYKEPSFLIEVMYVFYNSFLNGTNDVRNYILTPGFNYSILDMLIYSLDSKMNNRIILLALDFIRILLEYARNASDFTIYKNLKKKFESLDITLSLEDLQMDKRNDISEVANLIIADNWSVEEIYFLNNAIEKNKYDNN